MQPLRSPLAGRKVCLRTELIFETDPADWTVVGLMNNKLASYLSAKDWLRDAADVQSLIKRLRLPLSFAAPPGAGSQAAYRRVWVEPEG